MYLAQALANYFERKKGKVTFRNGLSLNKLALAMWEQSSGCGIDASILSKVLNGKRLFTPQQLSVFCKVTGIEHSEREYLFHCLHKDQCLKSGVDFSTPFVTSFGTHVFVEELMRHADILFLSGKWRDLYDLSGVIEAYLYQHALIAYQRDPEDPLVSAYHKAAYLRAKSMTSVTTHDTVVEDTRAAIRGLRQYPNSASAHLIDGYVASLKASACRVLGLFPSPRNATFDPKSAAMSKRYAAKAMTVLPPTDFEYLGSLRNVIDSSIAFGEWDEFLGYAKIADRIALIQPANNFLYAMQLAATVGKGMAVLKASNPFALREKMEKHFDRSIAGTRLYELCDLKTVLETHVALGSTKDSFLGQKIERALTLADEECTRFRDVIIRLASQLK
jgi:hypothetical protein